MILSMNLRENRGKREQALPSLCLAQTSITQTIPVSYLPKNPQGWRLHTPHRATCSSRSVPSLLG